MNAFKSALTRAVDRVYGTAGVAATYTDRNGVLTPCTVLVERDLTRYGATAAINTATAVVGVRATQVAAAPRRGERFTLSDSGQVLVVDSLQVSDELEHKVFAA